MSSDMANPKVLLCPSDGPGTPATLGGSMSDPVKFPMDAAPRSFIINGWNDWVKLNHPEIFKDYYKTGGTAIPVPENAARVPAETVVFGEKANRSGDFYMDYEGLDDLQQLNQNRHGSGSKDDPAGGSNYTFCDGSARFLKSGKSFAPINLWALTDFWREIAVGK